MSTERRILDVAASIAVMQAANRHRVIAARIADAAIDTREALVAAGVSSEISSEETALMFDRAAKELREDYSVMAEDLIDMIVDASSADAASMIGTAMLSRLPSELARRYNISEAVE